MCISSNIRNITGITYPGGLRLNYGYNALNLPVSVTDSVYSTTIQYDEVGNRLQEVLPNGVTVNNSYDLAGHLTDLTIFTTSMQDCPGCL